MFIYASILIFATNFIFIFGDYYCDFLGILYYKEIGCKAVYTSNSKCPACYNCPNLVSGDNYCIFQGEKYKIGAHLNYSNGCLMACSCQKGYTKGDPTQIVCAIPPCAHPMEDENGCTTRVPLGGCCPSEYYCPSSEITCTVDGIGYRDGDYFSPKDACWDCICKKGYRGIYEAPYCIRKRCSIGIWNYETVENKCLPVYPIDGALCCPSFYICSNQVDAIHVLDVGNNNKGVCSYADKKYAVNSKLIITFHHEGDVQKYNSTCSCILPPYLSCRSSF